VQAAEAAEPDDADADRGGEGVRHGLCSARDVFAG
jgi:hypothetical protein